MHPWRTYSKYFDGCFCLACVLFGRKTGQSDNKLTNLYKEPLTSWTHASERLKTHYSNSELHKDAMVIMELFKRRLRNEFVPADVLAYSVRQERIEKNRQKLKSALKIVIFCGQHDIALSGHRDDSKYCDSTSNGGNFQGLLNFIVACGDSILKEHFETCPKLLCLGQRQFKTRSSKSMEIT